MDSNAGTSRMTQEERELGAQIDPIFFRLIKMSRRNFQAEGKPYKAVFVHCELQFFLWIIYFRNGQYLTQGVGCSLSRTDPMQKLLRFDEFGRFEVYTERMMNEVDSLITDLAAEPGMSVTTYHWRDE